VLLHRETTQAVVDAFFRSYNRLDYGFSETVYLAALQRELRKAGYRVEREVMADVYYDGDRIARFKIDMLVDRQVIVEVKASAALAVGVERQVFNYLRATDLEVGLLLHYGPKPILKRYICTNDRKNGRDLYQATTTPFRRAKPFHPNDP
jgi:GxxExxY protein